VDQAARPAFLQQVFQTSVIVRVLALEVSRRVALAGRDGVATTARVILDRLDRHKSTSRENVIAMDWYTTTRKDSIIEEEFLVAWIAQGGPKNAAVFVVRDQPNRAMIYYLTPAAAALMADRLEAYGAVACPKPDSQAIRFLQGDQNITEGVDY
jgi:hypothetical protein